MSEIRGHKTWGGWGSRFLVLLAAWVFAFGCADTVSNDFAAGDAEDSDGDDGDAAAVPAPQLGEIEGGVSEVCLPESTLSAGLRPGDTNAMSAPALARYYIENGLPVDFEIREHEFLSYYDFDHPEATSGALGVFARAQRGSDGDYLMQIGLRGREIDEDNRPPVNLVLLMDTSTASAGGAMQRTKQVCAAVAGALRQGDTVSISAWDSAGTLLPSHPVDGPDDPLVIGHCNALEDEGTRDLGAGLENAYALAHESYLEDGENRVVLVSGTGGSVNGSVASLIASKADPSSTRPVSLMGIGVSGDGGPAAYDDSLMEVVTAAGGGPHLFIDTAAEAFRQLEDRFVRNMFTAAADVSVEVALSPTLRITSFAGAGEDPLFEGSEPRDLAPGDTIVLQLTLTSCSPNDLKDSDPFSLTVSFEDPSSGEERTARLDTSLGELLGEDPSLLRKGDAITAYARAIGGIHLASSAEASNLIGDALAVVSSARELLPGDTDLAEIEQLLTLCASAI